MYKNIENSDKKMIPSIQLFKTNLGIVMNEIKQQGNINGYTEPERRLKSLEEFSKLSTKHQSIFYRRMREYKTLLNKKYYPDN